MAEIKKELSDAEIASKTGFGETAEELEPQEDTAEGEEPTEKEEPKEEADESDESEEEEAEEEKPAAREKREISKDKEEEAEESDEPEGKSEEEEPEGEDKPDPSYKSKDKRTVPYSALKEKTDEVKRLQIELAKAKESGNEEDIEDATEEVEASAKELAEELGMDKDGIAKILKAAVKLSSKKSELPKEIVERLKTLDKFEAQNKQTEEVAHFNNEWESLDIAKQYPNAPKAAIKAAQDLMDKLAHSKDHHKHDLDYILFKNKAKFDTILKLAPKGKSGEVGKKIGTTKAYEDDKSDDEDMVEIDELTPAIMKEREQKDMQMRNEHRHDKDYRIYNPREAD